MSDIIIMIGICTISILFCLWHMTNAVKSLADRLLDTNKILIQINNIQKKQLRK